MTAPELYLGYMGQVIFTAAGEAGRLGYVGAVLKTCSEPKCTTLIPRNVARCVVHRLPSRGRPHRRAAEPVMRDATVCGLCGKPPTTADPLTRHHRTPRAKGGLNVTGNYMAAHASCNGRLGAR